MPRKIVLHIGASKCGSSSIQNYLSHYPIQDTASYYVYCVLRDDGKIIVGADVKEASRNDPLGYMVSTFFPENISHLTSNIRTLLHETEETFVPIFSCEDWFRKHYFFQRLAEELSEQVVFEIIFFVRPQVDWLNSAWWQWGVWEHSDDVRETWMRSVLPAVDWFQRYQEWVSIPAVSQVSVMDVSKDSLRQFLDILGVSEQQELMKTNETNCGPVLAFLKRNHDVRPRAHDSYLRHYLARECLALKSEKPWAVDSEFANLICEEMLESNRQLGGVISNFRPGEFEASERWLDSGYYADRTLKLLSYFDTLPEVAEHEAVIQERLLEYRAQ